MNIYKIVTTPESGGQAGKKLAATVALMASMETKPSGAAGAARNAAPRCEVQCEEGRGHFGEA
jgi:hypothetical protein